MIDYTEGLLHSASVATIQVPPGASHPRAKSVRCDKYYFCSEGSIAFNVEGLQEQLDARGLLVIPANSWFKYTNESSKTACLLLVHVPPFDLSAEVFEES